MLFVTLDSGRVLLIPSSQLDGKSSKQSCQTPSLADSKRLYYIISQEISFVPLMKIYELITGTICLIISSGKKYFPGLSSTFTQSE